jgi:hypothetical protein
VRILLVNIGSTILGRMRVSYRLKIATCAALAGILAACGTEDAPGPLEPSCEQQGRVRFVNLITDPARNPVNAVLEDVPWGVNLGYTATTPASLPAPSTALYSAVCSGDRTVVLHHTPNPDVVHATLAFTVAPEQDHTVYATGGAGATVITRFVTTDDNAAPAAGQTRVRIVNMSPTAGAIDVFLTAAGADLATATPTATNLAHQGTSAYLNVAPGTYTFRAVPAGTAPANRAASVTITQSGIVLSAGTGRSIVTADNNVGGTPLRAFVLSDR